MKKKIVAIMACAMMLLSAGASAEMMAGTYTGEGQGIGGAVKVAVTVEGGAIAAVEVVEHAETAGICDPAIEKIPAAIVAGQSLAVDTVTGATVTSKAILAAAEQALTEAGADIEALKTAAPKAEQAEGETIEMTTDVVVVGAGGAGVAAAVEANDNGASVVLLEKLTQIGGTTATSQGMVGGYETKYTKALDVHYTFEEMYGNLMSNASYRLDGADDDHRRALRRDDRLDGRASGHALQRQRDRRLRPAPDDASGGRRGPGDAHRDGRYAGGHRRRAAA